MTTQNKKLISLGILLSLTTFIAFGTAVFHMFNQPNNVNAEQVEDSSDEDTYTVITETPEPSSTTESTVEEVADSSEEPVTPVEEPVVQEETPVVVEEVATQEETPVVVEESTIQEEQSIVVEEPAVQENSAMTITVLGRVINYQNGGTGAGQSIIDANPYGAVSTWGGSAVQSGNDGLNTHFIGHNPGIFDILFSVTSGTAIMITDGAGTATTYTVQNVLTLDDYGDEVGTGTNYFDLVTGSGGGERVTFQTCINDSTNLIIVAYA